MRWKEEVGWSALSKEGREGKKKAASTTHLEHVQLAIADDAKVLGGGHGQAALVKGRPSHGVALEGRAEEGH
jgi:hypothetical protein